MSEQSGEYKPAVVTKVPVSNIEPNPHNPRALFDEEDLCILRESIEKLGVLVPVTVFPKIKTATDPQRDQFVLLDGERRWRCMKTIGGRLLPAIIVEQPTETSNVLIMFHIHNLRVGWQLMPTALKLEVLMKKLGVRNERKLAVLTKLTISQVRRCKILLSYSKKYQDMMLAPPNVHFKPDFFIELQRVRSPALTEEFPPWIERGDSKCIDIILEKYKAGIIKAVTDFRILAEIYRGSIERSVVKTFYAELEKFLANKDYGIENMDVPGATYEKGAKEVLRSARRLQRQIDEIPIEVVSADDRLRKALKDLSELIQKKIESTLVEEERKHA